MATVSEPAKYERLIGLYRGTTPGPTVVVITGVHGNELAGIKAAQAVLNRLQREKPTAFRGQLYVVAGNLAALNCPETKCRYIDSDLNRMFTPQKLASAFDTEPGQRTAEESESLELLRTLDDIFDSASDKVFCIDLHTVSSPAVPFIALEDNLVTRRWAQQFAVPLILGFEEELHGLLADYLSTHRGHVAMVLEAGLHEAPQSIQIHEAAIWVALDAAGILGFAAIRHSEHPLGRLRHAAGDKAWRCYDVRHVQPILDPSFEMAANFNAFDPVRTGEVVAHESGYPVATPTRGHLFMPNRQKQKRVGDDGFFVIRHVGKQSLLLSRWLRQSRWVHVLFHQLPGVRISPVDKQQILINPDYAAILKRQILHLLGYRILRHPNEVHLSRWRRFLLGCRRLAHALFAIPLQWIGWHRDDPQRSPEPNEWVATLRPLDRHQRR